MLPFKSGVSGHQVDKEWVMLTVMVTVNCQLERITVENGPLACL